MRYKVKGALLYKNAEIVLKVEKIIRPVVYAIMTLLGNLLLYRIISTN